MPIKIQKRESFFKKLSMWFQKEGKNFRPKKEKKRKEKLEPSKKRRRLEGKKFLPLLTLCLFPFSSLLGGFYEGGGYQGFYFFEEKATKEEKQKLNKPPVPQTPQEALIFLKVEKERLEALQALAICNPTHENLTNFFEQRNQMIELSSNFADQGMLALLERSDLGPDPKFPKNSFGIEFRKNLEKTQEKETLEKLGEHFFLAIVGEGGEPWSELAASIGETFANATKWTVRFLSLNGEKTSADLKTEFNLAQLETFPLRETPSFLMIDPKNKTMIPVGSGVPSVSLLMETIIEQANHHALLEKTNDR